MADKKTILFVSHKHPPSIGGMETHNYHLKLGLEKEFNLIPLIIGPQESRVSFFWNIRKKMITALHENHVDAVYVNDGLLALIVSGLKQKFPVVTFIATIHGLEATFPATIYQQRILPRLKAYDLLIGVSNFTKSILDNIKGLNGKTQCILNGIDHQVYNLTPLEKEEFSEKYAFLKNKKVLLSVGRPVIRKGFSWFAKNVLPSLDSDVKYVVAGPLPKKDRMYTLRNYVLPKSLNHQINLALGYPEDTWTLSKIENPNLILTGGLSYAELNYLIDRADLFIVPNIEVRGDAEGFGLVALEGAIHKKLVISADLQGLKDAIINGRNGVVLPSANKQKWIDACQYYLDHTSETEEFGRKAYEYTTNNYSWDKMVEEYIDLFKKM
jgi:glycosyltransferase involved in cell wall biosynthesis